MGRVLVVGSGPNGLSAAIAMAAAGHRVTVLEAGPRPGGGTRSEALTLPGFVHDVCSAVHPLAVASPFLRTLPLERHGLHWVQPPAPMAHPLDDGGALVLERSIEATAATLDRTDRRAYAELLGPFVERWPALLRDALAPPIHLPGHPLLMLRLARTGLRSAAGLARARFRGERARALLAGLAAHSLLPLERAPTAAIAIVLAGAAHASGWPLARGGSQAIADALVSLLRGLGGEVVTDTRIAALDELAPAAATLLDLTPRQVLRLAGHRLPPRYRRQLARCRYGPGAYKVDWALAGPIPWRAAACRRAGTVHLGGSAAEIAASNRAAAAGRVPGRPFVLLVQPSLFDESRAPAGRHTAWAYCHVPHGSTVDMAAAIEAQVERFAPGFRDLVLARHTFDPPALERHDANLVGGDINGGLEDPRQFFFRPAIRANPYTTPLRGVYLCSASTPPGGGVHGMCGFNAARAALARLR